MALKTSRSAATAGGSRTRVRGDGNYNQHRRPRSISRSRHHQHVARRSPDGERHGNLCVRLGPGLQRAGLFLVYSSSANNLAEGDTDGLDDIYVFNVLTGGNIPIELTHAGAPALDYEWAPAISADGRYVTFIGRDVRGMVEPALQRLCGRSADRPVVRDQRQARRVARRSGRGAIDQRRWIGDRVFRRARKC